MIPERMRMLQGKPYNSRDPELLALAHQARTLLRRYNSSDSTDADGQRALLDELLGAMGDDVWIEPPFFCEYGAHIHIGSRSFIHVNAVLLDSAEIRIGDDTLIGPGAQIITATHPLDASERLVANWTRDSGHAPYWTSALPITIGSRVWIGAGTILTPGVSIGDNTVIGAGSVVTRDIPADCVAYGQPCKVRKELRVKS
jgi:maltose O-acetyltransferase